MLAKDDILKRRGDFLLMKETGRLYQSPLFGLLVLRDRQQRKTGFIVSKKVSKRAVDRNKIKRLLAESVRVNLGKLRMDTWVVFLVKRRMLGLKFDEVRQEVERMFKTIDD